jgi:hypothetical protein
MSTVAFGALSTRREQSDSGKSTSEQPPGVSSYVDILAALVPAEVLAINSIVVASVTAQVPGGPAAAAEAGTYRWMFGLLLGLAAVLFVLGRRPAPAPAPDPSGSSRTSWQNWEWQDLFRMLIPPAAYVLWTMIEPSSVWSAIVPGMSSGTRLLIPLVGAAVLGAVTKALASHADKKPSPAQRRAAAAQRPAPHPAQPPAQLPAPNPVPGPVRPVEPAPAPPVSEAKPVGPAAPADTAADADIAEGADTADNTDAVAAATEAVPSWVY